MNTNTCSGCWHTAPRGTRLVTWPGLFDGVRGARLCVRCWLDLTGGIPEGATRDGYEVAASMHVAPAFTLALHRHEVAR